MTERGLRGSDTCEHFAVMRISLLGMGSCPCREQHVPLPISEKSETSTLEKILKVNRLTAHGADGNHFIQPNRSEMWHLNIYNARPKESRLPLVSAQIHSKISSNYFYRTTRWTYIHSYIQ